MKLKILGGFAIICLITGTYFLIKKNQSITVPTSEISQNKDVNNNPNLVPTTDSIATVTTNKIPELTTSNELKAGSFLETNGIKILSPKTGDEFTAGSSITIKYQILKPVKYGSILINCNNTNGIAAVIDESVSIGTYSKTCVLPDQIGLLRFAVNEMDPSNPDKLQSMFGTLNLTAPNNKVIRLEVGDNNQIEAIKYGEDPGPLYLSQIKTLPTSVYVKAVFEDGKQMFISANDKNLSFKIEDITVASLSSTITSTQSFQVIGMKPEGKTDIAVSYKGITRKIEALTPACDITMPCY
ncbi:MAG TPA: hypothetical protein PKZ56_01335 [Candidatus Paceibacterota bacterium]|nr:hypothetical protein [Candidatus Paceibacterota bacterium]